MTCLGKIKIISGGQTGVDRAALDFAIQNNIPCGGWCPKGRKAEDGIIPEHYPLIETTSDNYRFRTRKNVLKSDGTLILYLYSFDKGTTITKTFCDQYKKPVLQIKLAQASNMENICEWIITENIKTLNIAGSRESSEPGVYSAAKNFLKNILK